MRQRLLGIGVVLCVVGCVLLIGLTLLERQTKAEGGAALYVGTNAELWPMEYISDTQIVGHDIDLMDAIAAEMGVTAVYTDVSWDGIFDGLLSGEYDVIISAVTVTPEREKMVDFTLPYLTVDGGEDLAIVVRQDDDFLRNEINRALMQLRDDGTLEGIVSAVAADVPGWHARLPGWAHCWVHINDDPTDYASVQAAVDVASDGDTVKVAGYCTGVEARGEVTQTVYLSKTLTLRGGYTTTNWTASDPIANPTTLDAAHGGRVVYVTGRISPTIEGLRITGGDAAGQGGGYFGLDCGGGVYLERAGSATALSHNRVFSNTAFFGGGLCLFYGSATVARNELFLNRADAGAGLWLDRTEGATLSENMILSNTATNDGGGLYLLWGGADALTNNVVVSNTAGDKGGGLGLDDSEAMVSGNVVRGNGADGTYSWSGGGGVWMRAGDAVFINNIVADNHAHSGSGLKARGSALRLLHNTIAQNAGSGGVCITNEGTTSSTATFTNTILVSHTVGLTVTGGSTARLEATLWYGNEQDTGGEGAILPGTVNVYGDPAFADPVAGDYHLGRDSAAVDQGVDAGVTTDIDGHPRAMGEGSDIGADERFPTAVYLPVALKGYSP